MEIVLDAEKDAQNRAKHGLALGDAVLLEWEGRVDVPDSRLEYGEERRVAYAYIGDRLHVCVYTMRDGGMRIISLRKANKRETRNYGR
jgi:uncharacterized protein